jgi:hypothetical protein
MQWKDGECVPGEGKLRQWNQEDRKRRDVDFINQVTWHPAQSDLSRWLSEIRHLKRKWSKLHLKIIFIIIIIIIIIINIIMSSDSSVVVATGYGLDGRDSIPGKARDFSLLHNIQTCSEIHPASYPIGIGGSFPWSKAAGERSWLLSSTQCRSKKWWSCKCTPPYVFMARYLIN